LKRFLAAKRGLDDAVEIRIVLRIAGVARGSSA